MTRKTVPERSGLAAAHTRDVFYAYDNRGPRTRARFDHLGGEGVANSYARFGRLASSGTTMRRAERLLSFQHGRDGNRVRLTYADRRVRLRT